MCLECAEKNYAPGDTAKAHPLPSNHELWVAKQPYSVKPYVPRVAKETAGGAAVVAAPLGEEEEEEEENEEVENGKVNNTVAVNGISGIVIV
jgi:hypothetical protein